MGVFLTMLVSKKRMFKNVPGRMEGFYLFSDFLISLIIDDYKILNREIK
jgi:hypothetical protein